MTKRVKQSSGDRSRQHPYVIAAIKIVGSDGWTTSKIIRSKEGLVTVKIKPTQV